MLRWQIGVVLLTFLMIISAVMGILLRFMDWMQTLLILFTIYFLTLFVIATFMNKKTGLKEGNIFYRPFVSILIPARNEEFVIADTVESMMNLRYHKKGEPNYEVVVIDDASKDNTYNVLSELMKKHSNLKVLKREGERAGTGKSSALNDALKIAKGEAIAVFDADTQVSPNFLANCIPYLYGDKVGGVQGRVRIYNSKKNLLTEFQNDEFSVICHLMQKGRQIVKGMTALSGNGQITKRSALEEVGGWNENSTTEDLDLTIRMLLNGNYIRYCADATLWQEGIDNFWALLRQRIRWVDGLFKSTFDYIIPLLFMKKVSLSQKTDAILGLSRITIPLWLIIGNFLVLCAILSGFRLYSLYPIIVYRLTTVISFIILLLAFMIEDKENIFDSLKRVLRYWLCCSIWLIAAPIAFVKIAFSKNHLKWDKTFHKGDVEVKVSKIA